MRSSNSIFVFSCLSAVALATVIEIQFMTQCVTRHDAWIYNGYGCYCGIGGSGEILDGIDNCCANHDHCYDTLYRNKSCWSVPFEYLPYYSWKCNERTVQCTGMDTFGFQFSPHDCAAKLCECDRALVECWSQFPEPKKQLKCPHPRLFYHGPGKAVKVPAGN